MRLSTRQGAAEFLPLQARYRAAWRQFSEEVDGWHRLQAEVPGNALRIHEAEAAVQAAEQQYRQARHAFAEHLLEHSSRESLLASPR